MAINTFEKNLLFHQERGFFNCLQIKRGIERESLRIDKNGKISQKDHPLGLGSPLTNKNITTDFSEALVELVTPTFDSAESLFRHLSDLHHFLYTVMDNEILWNFSMPCSFKDESDIRIANYGQSNIGMLKHIYRKGLRLRYGSIMQCVSGIHYNFSLSETSWNSIQGNPNQDFINQKYFGLIRNVKRNFWFLLEQFGASPIAHKSYLHGRKHALQKYGTEDLFLPEATALRMSEIGYQSPVQESLKINYNHLDEFIDAVIAGISTPYKKFKELGLIDKNGVPQQISEGILQIENELYDIIRPKRTGPSGHRPANLLKQHGVEYIELRGLDINPFIPEGISENKIKLLDIFLMHALISESPNVLDGENQEIKLNHRVMVNEGRSPNVMLLQNFLLKPLSEVRKIFHEELFLVAEAMDGYQAGYSQALNSELNELVVPSQKIMDEMEIMNISFKDYGLSHSNEIAETYTKENNIDFLKFIDASKESLKDLKKIEETKDIDINKYIKLYNSKLKEEK